MKDRARDAHRTLPDSAGSSLMGKKTDPSDGFYPFSCLCNVLASFPPFFPPYVFIYYFNGVVHTCTFYVITDVFVFLSAILQLVFNLTCLFHVLLLLDFFWVKQKVIPFFLFIDLLILLLFP